ncbi:MAG: DUF5703 domain-containing protein [Planctomycetota bacterium]
MHRVARIFASIACLALAAGAPAFADGDAQRAFAEIAALDPVAHEPGDATADPMLVGNGAFCASVSVDRGGEIVLALGHADARDADGRHAALGRVRVALDPPLPAIGFAQRWHLAEGFVAVTAGIAGDRTRVEIFVDPELPVLHLVLASATPRRVRATLDALAPERTLLAPDDEPDALVWYGRNERSIVPELLAKAGLEEHASSVPDLLILRTFCCRMEGVGFARDGDATLRLDDPATDASLRIGAACSQADGLSSWLARLAMSTAVAPDAGTTRARTTRWWRDRFARSWVLPGDRASAGAWLRARAERLAIGGGAIPSGCGAPPWQDEGADAPTWSETRDAHAVLAACGDADRLAALADLHLRALSLAPLLPADLQGDRLDAAVALLGVARADPTAARGIELLSLLVDAWALEPDAPAWSARILPIARAVLSEGEPVDARCAEIASRLLVLAAATAHPEDLARWSRLARSEVAPLATGSAVPAASPADPCERARFAAAVAASLVRAGPGAPRLLPSWPVGRDIAFRLPASGGLTASGRIERGAIVELRLADGTRDHPFELGEGWRAREAAALPAASR